MLVVQHVLYLIGLAAFAASGVLAAHEARLDAFGGIILAFATAVSGGTVRDVLLGRYPLYWTRDPALLAVIATTAVATVVYLRYRRLPHRILLAVDALGLSMVTVMATRAALSTDVTLLAVPIFAVITGVTGELVRDVLCGKFPPLLLREEIYAIAALAGSVCYLVLDRLGVAVTPTTIVSASLVFVLRMLAVYFNLRLPTLHPRHTRRADQ